ncbi:MAG: HIT domain-containing protein [Deltaproteobacteria bacterium]|nr:HIT domain-containing protein [Deltaproteobacteria bacterium]MBI3294338.1 HIT domain-containing protein [Deltaproteobacteria bacterium]
MQQLWAPWRMEFIEGKKESGCVFCRILKEKTDRENLVLKRTPECFVILNKYPYNNAHLMVVPNEHTNDFVALKPGALNEMGRLAQAATKILQEVVRPEGFNTGMNLGHAAGAGIREHLHLHIVPRWVGDTNFLPVVGLTKSMPQHLLDSYDSLVDHFRRLS